MRHLGSVLIALLLSCPLNAWSYTQDQLSSVTTPEETQINHVRDQEIAQLKIVLGRRFAENRRPDILLRLAELYIEKYRYYFFKENQIHQNLYKQGVKESHVNHDHSRAELKAATSACLSILKSRVSFPKMDEVYYFLGYNAEEMGNHKEAARYFEVIARRFPSSTYAPEAFRNLGETAFESGKYAQAVGYYERAAQFTKVPSFPRTLYKLAWGYFKVRRKSDALETMKRVIEVSGKDDKFVGLRDEALSDIVLFFSEAGRLAEAHGYFSGISGGPEVYAKALTKLAGVYEHRGDRKLAIKTNEGLIAEYADSHPDLIFDALAKNVELYRKLADAAGEEGALKRLVEFFAKHGDDIAKAKGEDAAATYARAKSYLRGRATEVHKEARKKSSPALFSRAAELYSLYIKAFLSNPASDKEIRERSEIDAYRSDALLAAGRESEAMPELERTLVEKGDPKLRRDAGTQLLNMLLKRLDASHGKGKVEPKDEEYFLRVADEYEKSFPDDKLVVELKYKRARLSAEKSGPEGLNGDARDALSELVEKYPDRPEAADAARDLVADLLKRKKEEKAVELAQTYLATPRLVAAGRKSDFERYLHSIVERKAFTDVSREEKDASKADDISKTAANYERLAESSRDTEVASKALNNAAVNYSRAGNTSEAIRVYLKLLAKYPGTGTPKDDLKHLAAELLWKSRFAEASQLYAKLSGLEVFTRDERTSFAHTAFTLAWGTGDYAGAYALGSRAVRELCEAGAVKKGKKRAAHHPSISSSPPPGRPFSDSRCHELALDLAHVQNESGHPQEAVNDLKAYLGHSSGGIRRAEAAYLLGSLYQQIHEGPKAALYYEDAARAVGHGGKGAGDDQRERNFAAHAAFLLVEPYFNQFAGLKLELPEDRLKATTRKKLADLESLVTRYSNVVKYGDGEWGIAALERLYDTFTAFAAELDHAPVPARLQGAQIDAYKRGIAGVSGPMAARGFEYLKQAYQKGLELGVTSPTFIAVTQRLSRRSPREYPPAHYAMASGEETSRQSTLRLLGAVQEGDVADLKRPDHQWRQQVAQKLAQNAKNADTWVEFGNLEALSGRLRIARLLYEQAVNLSPKNAAALGNLSVVLFLAGSPIEATQGLKHAAGIAEFSKDLKLNLAKALLAYHHFGPAAEHLRALVARFPDDRDVQEAQAASLLGTGQLAQAGAKLQALDAQGSKKFTLWYNWSVWAGLSGDKDQREKAMDLLKDRREGLGALEKAQAELATSIISAAAAGGKP